MKTHKWYPSTIKPDRKTNLIVMTDMGHLFEAVYKNGRFLVSIVRNYKIYYEEWLEQSAIIKWMKI